MYWTGLKIGFHFTITAVRITTATILHAMPTTITITSSIHMVVNNKPARHIIFRLMFNTRAVILLTAVMVTTTRHKPAVTTD